MSVFIALSPYEYEMAWQVGYERCHQSKKAGHKHVMASDHLTEKEVVMHNAQAVAAEMAVANWLGYTDHNYTPHVNTFKNEADVPPDWEVKHSRYETAQFMPIQDNDRDTDKAVFVRGFPIMEIVGWLPVSYCKFDGYHSNDFGRGWFYKVPIHELKPIAPPKTAMNENNEPRMVNERDVLMRCVGCGCWIMAPMVLCSYCESWRLPR